MTEIDTKPIPQRFPEELVSSALFLLKRLGMTAKERSFSTSSRTPASSSAAATPMTGDASSSG